VKSKKSHRLVVHQIRNSGKASRSGPISKIHEPQSPVSSAHECGRLKTK